MDPQYVVWTSVDSRWRMSLLGGSVTEPCTVTERRAAEGRTRVTLEAAGTWRPSRTDGLETFQAATTATLWAGALEAELGKGRQRS